MKYLGILIVVPFLIVMALIVGFQFIRIIFSELKALAVEAWRTPEIQSPS